MEAHESPPTGDAVVCAEDGRPRRPRRFGPGRE
jgi:hypothetical protein